MPVPVSLSATLKDLSTKAEALAGSPQANEANTRVVLIEPLLGALGWDTADPLQVHREYPVYDGTKLDYALLIDGEPRLFVEAKAVGEELRAPKFVAQAINYANNEGVLWCVLTDGINYRVYKANEPVGMEDKLLFEADLSEAAGRAGEVARVLGRISPDAVASGELDAWGEQLFADGRVRDALARLGSKAPDPLIEMLTKQLGQPKLSDTVLRASLSRVLAGSESPPTPATTKKAATRGGRPKGGAKEYPIEHHTAGKPQEIVAMFEDLDAWARTLGPDVSRVVRKLYISYTREKKSFFTTELQQTKLWIYLSLPPTPGSSYWDPECMRDVTNIGHYGLGDTEYRLASPSQLGDLKQIITVAYEKASKPAG